MKAFINLQLISLTLLLNGLLYGQAFHATYTYDSNGNRTRAEVYYLSTTLKSGTLPLNKIIPQETMPSIDTTKVPTKGWEQGGVDVIGDLVVKVYPNPTTGKLLIEIEGASADQLSASENRITVWDLNGLELLKIWNLSQFNSLDLSNYPVGTYLAKVLINGKVKEFKIIKN